MVGDQVLIRIHGIRPKLHPKFSHIPRIIISANHPPYIVQDPQSNTTSRIDVSDLRPLYVD